MRDTMDEKDKKIHLSFFVLFSMNVFYALISQSFIYLVYFVFALVVAYFVVYPDKFFLVVDDAKVFGKRVITIGKRRSCNSVNMDKGNKGTNIPDEMVLDKDDHKGHEEKRVGSEDTENSRKRSNDALYY